MSQISYLAFFLFYNHLMVIKPLILLWSGQLLDFCSGPLPVADFVRIMLPVSCWPHPAREIFSHMASLGHAPMNESDDSLPR